MNFFQNNPWVGYAERSYMAMKQQIILRMQNPITGIPEITDHSESNPFIKRLSIWCGINEQLGYYVDNKGRESFLLSARLYKSVINIAKQYDYRVRGIIAATGEVTFISNIPVATDYNIPAGTVVKTSDGIQFETLSSVDILTGQTSVTVAVRQWTKVAASILANSNGQPNQKITLGENVVDNSVAIIVNGITPYTAIESFVFAENADNVFKQQMDENGDMEIVFGDGVNGAIPPNTQSISVEYYTSQGAAGNVGIGAITEFVTVLAPPAGAQLSVTNNLQTVNGTDAESIAALKKNIPLSLRSLYRAVTPQDFIDVTELAPGVAKAGYNYSCGKYIDIYIAPNGGGIASNTLLSDTSIFLNLRKSITTFPIVNAAGQIIVEYAIQVKAKPNFYNSQVYANVLQTLQEFHNIENQSISGSVYIGDIYQAIENTTGVQHSLITMMRPIPYARPILPSYVALNWNRQQSNNAVNATYRVTFISPTTFKVLRNNVYLGTHNVSDAISLMDLDFTVLPGVYVAGYSYEFKTYNISGSVQLSEPSLPTFNIANSTITVTGGLI